MHTHDHPRISGGRTTSRAEKDHRHEERSPSDEKDSRNGLLERIRQLEEKKRRLEEEIRRIKEENKISREVLEMRGLQPNGILEECKELQYKVDMNSRTARNRLLVTDTGFDGKSRS